MENINYKNITGVHLELTTKCNACCPMCNRNYKGKVRENLKLAELSLDDCKKIFSKAFLSQLELISICGVLGDPANATELIPIVEYFASCNENLTINIYTNGSIHNTDWWVKLANTIKKGRVIFGIDGIGETSSLHRCNTNYDKVIENAKAFINAGGMAQWDFIAFKHNESQIEEARKLSIELGFADFQIKKTSRFFKTLYEKDPALDSTILNYGKHPVFTPDSQIAYYIEPPENPNYRNAKEENMFEVIETNGTFEKYLDKVDIDCGAIRTGGIFVSAFGEIFPCCTVYQQVCYGSIFGVTDESELNEYKLYLNDDLSAFHHSIEEIINGNFFENIQKSWYKTNICDGKSKACSRTCGKNLDVHQAQHSLKT